MNIDDMTLGQLKEVKSLLAGSAINNEDDMQPFEIGKAYLIRTVTHISIGLVEKVGDKELVLSSASWIADTGRFHQCLSEGTLDEIEPYVNDVILGRGAIVDATLWHHEVPRKQK